jgi:outer membrane murein-binding lipoprotein Lpp
MAADAYVTAAAGHLESAANELKMEADQIRGEFMTYDREVTRQINAKDAEMRSHAALLLTAATDDQQKLHYTSEVQRLKGEIDQLKRDLQQRRQQTDSAVRSKEGAVGTLMSMSRDLRSKAGNFK